MNVFITGVSKGIGLSLTTEALKKGFTVYGVARSPHDSAELQELRKNYPTLHLVPLDLTDDLASKKLTDSLNHVSSFDIVINNAGIYEKGTSKEEFLHSFEVNTYIPFMVAEALLPKLKKSSSPKLVHVTSLMGSIEETTSGGSYAYRASKAALNMVNKCLTVENDWLTTLVIHPGWVQTDMGGESAPVTPAVSGQGIWKVIEGIGKKESGSFKDYQGRSLPW